MSVAPETSLLSDALAFGVRKGPKCSVAIFFRTHPELADELREAMASEVASTSIALALKARKLTLSPEPIQRHRRGSCQCPR